jgi:hypothetical protein
VSAVSAVSLCRCVAVPLGVEVVARVVMGLGMRMGWVKCVEMMRRAE